MSYIEHRKKLELIKPNTELKSYETDYLTKTYCLEDIKNEALEYLYTDIIEKETGYKFCSTLGPGNYCAANIEASTCIDITLRAREVYPKKLPDWTEHSQKCMDYLLIKYISDGLKEKIDRKKGIDYETDVYEHLEEKDEEELQIIGSRFHWIYQYRSKFKHVQYTDENGYRRIKPLRNKELNKAKEVIIDFFKEALTIFLIGKIVSVFQLP